MTRSATAAALAAFEAEHVPLLAFVEMQFASGTVRVCNAFESVPWNGFTWLGLGNLGTIEPIEENTDLGMSGIGLQLSGVNPALIATALGEQYQGRRCNIWLAPLGVDDLATLEFDFAGTKSLVPRFGSATVTFTRSGATATRVNASGLIETVAADTPRFDFDPRTLACKGLLIEEARTNLCLRSQELDVTGGGAWLSHASTNVSVSANTDTAPDGSLTADTVTTTSTADPRIQANFTVANDSVSRAASILVKKQSGKASYGALRLNYSGGTVVNGYVVFNENTGVITAASAAVVSSGVEEYPDYWRVQVVVSNNSSGNTTLSLSYYPSYNLDGGLSVNAQNGVSSVLWGAQLESAAAFASSYIPTTSASVTRNADIATVSSIGGFFNASEGAFALEAMLHALQADFRRMVGFTDGTGNERFHFEIGTGDDVRFQVSDGGVSQVGLQGGTAVTPGVPFRAAAAYKANDFALSQGGAAALTDTSGTLPTVTRLNFMTGDNGTSSASICGHLRRFTYYAKRLTNEQLVARSAEAPSGYAIIADPIGPFRFRMDTMSIDKGKTATITVTAENRLADWDRARIRRWTDEDQKADFPTDRFFEFIPELQEKEIIF